MSLGFADDTNMPAMPLVVGDDELTKDQRVFLNAYLTCKTIRGTERITKINHFYHAQWLANSPEYQAAWAQVSTAVKIWQGDKIVTRAVDGWNEPLHYQGRKTGHNIRRFSDTLSKGMMQAIDPSWRDGGITVNVGPQSLAITHSNVDNGISKQGNDTLPPKIINHISHNSTNTSNDDTSD